MTEPVTGLSDPEAVRDSLADPELFGLLFDRHFDAVYGYLVRRGGKEIADELAGEVFRVAFEQRRRFDLQRPSARPWLYGIAANVLRRHLRQGSRRRAAYRRLLVREPVSAPDDLDAADAAMDAGREGSALASALSTLASHDREPLLLHVWEDLPYVEIADALDIPIGTVRSRIHRARRELRARLGESNQPGGHVAAAQPAEC